MIYGDFALILDLDLELDFDAILVGFGLIRVLIALAAL